MVLGSSGLSLEDWGPENSMATQSTPSQYLLGL